MISVLRAARLPLACLALAVTGARAVEVSNARISATPDNTRIVLDLTGIAAHHVTVKNPNRLVLDIPNGHWKRGRPTLMAGRGAVRQLRVDTRSNKSLKVIVDLARSTQATSYLASPDRRNGYRLIVDLGAPASRPAGQRAAAAQGAPAAQHAPAGSPVQRRLARRSGEGAGAPQGLAPRLAPPSDTTPIKIEHAPAAARDLIIAVDAGHGGDDPGATGMNGTHEKTVVLAIARELAQQIDAESGMHAVLTRDGDYFVELRDRMRRARKHQADLFVSIHADSIADHSVSGSSVYILSQRGASDEAARWLAERENAADLLGGVKLENKNDVLASVLLDLSQTAALNASQTAAGSVLKQLDQVGDVRKHQVQQARFLVLKSPDMPSMLVETAYISNPTEERRLREHDQQARIAAAIQHGLKDYFYTNPPSGTRIAQRVATEHASASLNTVTDTGG